MNKEWWWFSIPLIVMWLSFGLARYIDPDSLLIIPFSFTALFLFVVACVLRAKSVQSLNEFAQMANEEDQEIYPNVPEYIPKDIVFTCDICSLKHDCEYAYDEYNTDGDCLASK